MRMHAVPSAPDPDRDYRGSDHTTGYNPDAVQEYSDSLTSILEVFDANVYYCLIGNRGPCTQGRPISVTSDDITFFRDR